MEKNRNLHLCTFSDYTRPTRSPAGQLSQRAHTRAQCTGVFPLQILTTLVSGTNPQGQKRVPDANNRTCTTQNGVISWVPVSSSTQPVENCPSLVGQPSTRTLTQIPPYRHKGWWQTQGQSQDADR